jgi:hypothetical protein
MIIWWGVPPIGGNKLGNSSETKKHLFAHGAETGAKSCFWNPETRKHHFSICFRTQQQEQKGDNGG